MILQDQARMTTSNGRIPRVPTALDTFRSEIKQPSELDNIALEDENLSNRLLDEIINPSRVLAVHL